MSSCSEAGDIVEETKPIKLTLKKRRRRTIITGDQLSVLEKLYRQDQWPSRTKKEKLAKEIGMTEHFVSIWFQNKRARMKRESEEKANKMDPSGSQQNEQKLNMSNSFLQCSLPKIQSPQMLKLSRSVGSSKQGVPLSMSTDTEKKETDIDKLDEVDSLVSFANSISPLPYGPDFDAAHKCCTPEVNLTDSNLKETNLQERTLNKCASLDFNHSSGETLSKIRPKGKEYPLYKLVSVKTTGVDRLIRIGNSNKSIRTIATSSSSSNIENTRKEVAHSNMKRMENMSREDVKKHQPSPKTLFRAVVNMIALAEGGIILPGSDEFGSATNDALYGIYINEQQRLTYSLDFGLDLIDID